MSDAQQTALEDTVNLPRTGFPMKANLAELEPRLLAWWEERGIYRKMLEKNAGSPRFVLHDGPVSANGPLHTGHALNKILKDIVVKYRNLSGRLCDFVPGWDAHGLVIEQAVEQWLADRKIDPRGFSRQEFLEKCRAYALGFVDLQRKGFKQMGVMGRWDEPYVTLSFDYEARVIRELATFAKQGFLCRRKKPVAWCLTDRTALVGVEVEDEDRESPSVYVAFDAAEDLGRLSSRLAGRKVAFVSWTPTPWTLPANLALAVHPAVEYVFYDLGSRVVCVAKDVLPRFLGEASAEHLAVKEVKLPGAEGAVEAASLVDPTRLLAYAAGEELAGLTYRHPFYERLAKVLPGEHVTLEQGTGLLHTAPGHGQEDYELGLAHGLDVYAPLTDDGRYDDSVGPLLAGKTVSEADPIIVDLLAEKGALLNARGDTVRHRFPRCGRCHQLIFFRAILQWCIALEKNDLRQRALAAIERVQWLPKWGRARIRGMLETRPDWCISRSRAWGVPLPVALCEGCGHAVVSPELMEKVAQAVEKEGAGAWYRTPVEEFLPKGFTCPGCGQAGFRRETDILDVSFDSACSLAPLSVRPHPELPVDLCIEGSDQHRGWFHSTLLVAVGTRDDAPYKSVLAHGAVVDGQGRKLSQRLANAMTADALIHQHGAELLRLWVASSDCREDIRLSGQILEGVSEGHRKIRNTLRYALSNLYDFDPAKDAVKTEELQPLDRWAKLRLGERVTSIRAAYEAYGFHRVYHLALDFCVRDLSARYFDIVKNRLYTSKASGKARRSAQTVLFELTRDLTRLLAPMMSFTAEEAWQALPGKPAESVFLAGLPESAEETRADSELLSIYDKLFAIRTEVQMLLEGARRDEVIGASREAKVVLWARGEARAFLEQHHAELPTLFIVSQVELATGSPSETAAEALPLHGFGEGSAVRAEVLFADGEKCPRCWTYSLRMSKRGEVCARCVEALA